MIFIADSGSTKCDGVFMNATGEVVSRVAMTGLNPHFHTSTYMEHAFLQQPEISKYSEAVNEVHYYGTGCSTAALKEIVAKALRQVFPKAKITVQHDLMAAALATLGHEAGISCILGTGSNSVYYDGKNITKSQAGLGFVLGDEGSASHIGRQLIRAFLYQNMPAHLQQDFADSYNMQREDFIQHTLRKPHVNTFLAGFAPFADKHLDEPFIKQLLRECFDEFVQLHVLSFDRAKEVPVSFVGTVAFHFKGILQEVLEARGLRLGPVVQKPIDGLVLLSKKLYLKGMSP